MLGLAAFREGAADPEAGVKRAVLLVLMSPRFLYPQLGGGGGAEPDGFTVASRLALDGVRVIAMLRDPVERAWSHYRHEVDLGYESLPFVGALDAEDRRLAGEEERLRSDPRYVSFAHQHHSYVARGRYAAQLRRWFDALGSQAVLVIRSEDLYSTPEATFARVLEHIGVRPWDPGDWRVRNAATSRGLDDEVRARLRGAFADDRADLATLHGGDPGWPP